MQRGASLSTGDMLAPSLDQLGAIFEANKRPVAGLVMNAELLLATAQTPPDIQVARVRRVTDLIPPREGGGDCPGSVLILVFNNPGAMPAQMFAGDPEMRSVHVRLPENKERRQWLEQSVGVQFLRGGAQLDEKEMDSLVAATAGEALKTLWGLSVLSRQPDGDTDPQGLLRLYRYGTRDDPWSDTGLERRLANLATELPQKLVGQEHAVRAVLNALDRAVYAGGSGQNKPRGVLFFAGPTGVGKSMMAKLIAEALFNDRRRVTTFDMSEYQGEFGHSKLIGAGPGFVGYEQGGRLIEAVRQDPFQVLLFDEFEKASPRLYDLFLQILDEARCTDNHGRVAYFGQSVIIFTSNIGGSTYPPEVNLANPTEADFGRCREHYLDAVQRCFYDSPLPGGEGGIGRPELYHRIGEENVIAFNPLIGAVRQQVARATVREVQDEQKAENPESPLDLDVDAVADFLLSRISPDGAGGGREIHRMIGRLVRDALVRLRKQTRAIGKVAGPIRIDVDTTNDMLLASWKG
jgi:hypothetical protein